jgi:hypothetical protein
MLPVPARHTVSVPLPLTELGRPVYHGVSMDGGAFASRRDRENWMRPTAVNSAHVRQICTLLRGDYADLSNTR